MFNHQSQFGNGAAHTSPFILETWKSGLFPFFFRAARCLGAHQAGSPGGWLGVCVGDYFLHDVWQCWPMVGGYVWSRRYQTAGRYLLIDLDTETEQPVSSPAPASLRLLFYNQNVLRVS